MTHSERRTTLDKRRGVLFWNPCLAAVAMILVLFLVLFLLRKTCNKNNACCLITIPRVGQVPPCERNSKEQRTAQHLLFCLLAAKTVERRRRLNDAISNKTFSGVVSSCWCCCEDLVLWLPFQSSYVRVTKGQNDHDADYWKNTKSSFFRAPLQFVWKR